MRIVRFRDGESIHWGVLQGEDVFHMPDAPFWAGGTKEYVGALDSVQLLAPVDPAKIVCVGMNYAKHITERDPNRKIPTEPVLFMKPQTALIGNGEAIRLAHPDHENHHEAELVVVIGRTARFVNEDDALDYVLGYTCGNDVSDRTLQAQDGQFVRAKGFDTYAPMGPVLQTDLDPSNLAISCTVNGETRQQSTTSTMIWSVPQLISFISGVMTLEPGDVIMTGTPEGVGPLNHGDTVAVSIEKIGTLENHVRFLHDETAIPLGPKGPGGGA
ncbi:MAG TPA: fumarylacetoacetate hydrolase family protein [Thermomicrobiales bacterium]|nr:fumarylacetoacetate hydrolase family protein [Thermomicrobiales bacterium]